MVREKGVKKERKKDERRPLQSQWGIFTLLIP